MCTLWPPFQLAQEVGSLLERGKILQQTLPGRSEKKRTAPRLITGRANPGYIIDEPIT